MNKINKLIERCGYQNKHDLGLWLMRRYKIEYEEANNSFMKGVREQERDDWESLGERMWSA